jgi:hypothetical protein
VISKLLDKLAPVRTVPAPDRGYRRLLRWASLPVIDRRWAAPMAAVALGFGLFAGIAIGPAVDGGFATGGSPVIEIRGLASGEAGADEAGEGGEEGAESGFEASPGESFGGESEAAESTFPESEFSEAPESEEEETTPVHESEEEDEGEPKEELITLSGVVVHANPAAGSYAVAEASGALSAVHAQKLPSPGTKVSVAVRTLANGTFAEGGTRRKTGTAAKAKLEGIVTHVDATPTAPAYVVSKRGVSVLVKVRPDPSGAPPALPVLGAFAVVEAEIEKLPAASASVEEAPATPEAAPVPEAPVCEGAPVEPPKVPAAVATLWQVSLDASGVPFTYSDFAGVVMAVCPQQHLLAISADDLREGGADLLVSVPGKLATAKLVPGDSILATADIGVDGSLTLKGLASDERSKGADDAGATQGDLVNHLAE